MTSLCVDCVDNVLLLLVVGIAILGLSMKVSAMLVKVVTKCSLVRVVLISTSGLSIRERNRTTVLNVVKTSHIGVILDNISRVSTRQSESTRTESSEKNKPTV